MNETRQYDFLPLTLRMETLGGAATPIVRRGTPLPAKRMQQFSTTTDNQKAVRVEVYLGESPIVVSNTYIGQLELGGIPEAPKREVQIEVLFEVDKTCTLHVAAKEKKTGTVITSDIQVPPEHLTSESVEESLRAANDTRQEDQRKAQAIEVKNTANFLVHRAEKYLQDQQRYALGNAVDRQIEEMVASLGLSLQQDNISAIRDKSKRLQDLIPSTGVPDLGAIFGGGNDIFAGIFGPPQRQTRRTSAAPRKATADSKPKPKKEQTEEVEESKKGLFAAGTHFDAKRLVRGLFAQATSSIVIIDGYVGEDVLALLTDKRDGVVARLLTGKTSPAFLALARDFARQYKGIEIRSSSAFHDRFVIVDEKDFYHFGASLEHLGNKAFMFSKIEEPTMQNALRKQWEQEWKRATQKL